MYSTWEDMIFNTMVDMVHWIVIQQIFISFLPFCPISTGELYFLSPLILGLAMWLALLWSGTIKRSDILPYLQANKLFCPSFMDVGRRHETSMSETKNFITLLTVARASAFSWVGSQAPGPTGWYEEGQLTPALTVSCTVQEKPELKEPKSFIKDSEHVCFLFWRGDPISMFEEISMCAIYLWKNSAE